MSTVLSCPHGDIRDCHACLTAAHGRVLSAWRAIANGRSSKEQRSAHGHLSRAKAAQAGFELLSESGIALWSHDADPLALCAVCSVRTYGKTCPSVRCPGRRVRFQPPEAR